MAYKVPVVSTKSGSEGLAVNNDVEILKAETAQEFVYQLKTIIENNEIRENIIQNAYEFVEANHSQKKIGEQRIEIFEAVIRNNKVQFK